MFVHEDPEFDRLIRIVADATGVSPALVEKDYWVTHALWSLQHQGFETWLKGGTSLSKGFGLIQRFSEDLDLKIEPGIVSRIPAVEDGDWDGKSAKAKRARSARFEALEQQIAIAGTTIARDPGINIADSRETKIRVLYPGRFSGDLPAAMRSYVLLEVGVARVTPCVEKDLSSFVHDHLVSRSQLADYDDNRPRGFRCVHPVVTALEKLQAISAKYPRPDVDAAGFIRHYEDLARIATSTALPPLAMSVRELADEMLRMKQIRWDPTPEHEALVCPPGERRDQVLRAYADIGSMFWGRRISFDEACEAVRDWIGHTLAR
jgi:hypothetical protein